MPSIVSRRLSLLVPVVIALLFVFGDSKPAAAQDHCFQNYRTCAYQAALKNGWWEMWSAGADCELDLVQCVRRKLIG